MATGRAELETLSRPDLVQRAKALGVARADVLTRLELIDEIISASVIDEKERTAARGLLGRARDLVARVVEKGLHLPDAAQRLRSSSAGVAPNVPEPIPTLALAQVYARQGHRKQAKHVVQQVLACDPQNRAAIAFEAKLTNQKTPPNPAPEPHSESAPSSTPVPTPTPASQPEADIPQHDQLLVEREPQQLLVSWQLRPLTFARFRARMPAGRLVLRLAQCTTGQLENGLTTHDVQIDRLVGTLTLPLPKESLSSHVALGWRDGSTFVVLITEH